MRASRACWCRKWSRGGIEAILGITNDPLFGPAVMFGLGGIFAEVLKDVAFRLAPVTPSMAREMIAEIKGYPVLAGARGTRAGRRRRAGRRDRAGCRRWRWICKDQVAELDINPLFVFRAGQGREGGGCADQA